MAFIADSIRDSGLDYATSNATRIDVCSQEPTTYTEATSTYTLGNKTGLSAGSPRDATLSGGGREVALPTFSDGSITGDGTITHYAVTDGSAELLATGSLSSSQAVTNGNTLEFDSETIIQIKDVA